MKTITNKPDHSKEVQDFLARGGVITKCPSTTKPKRTRDVDVVEIDISALPKELLRLLAE